MLELIWRVDRSRVVSKCSSRMFLRTAVHSECLKALGGVHMSVDDANAVEHVYLA
jgi:hypothetical protein